MRREIGWAARVWRRRRGIAAALAAVMLTAGCSSIAAWSTSAPAPLVIGVDLNLSGRGADTGGQVFEAALRLQVEQLREQRPSGGGVELRVLDHRGDAATSAQNLRELAADPQVAAVITAGCPSCVIDLADELTVPLISLDPAEEVAAPAELRRWVFRLGPNAGDVADVLSATIAGDGAATVALVTTQDLYGEEGARWVADAAGRDGWELVTHLRVGTDEASVAAAADAVVRWRPEPTDAVFAAVPPEEPTGPDAVVVWAAAPQAQQLAAALRQAGYPGRLYLDMLAADTLFLADTSLQDATVVFTATPVADQRVAASPALAARQAWLRSYLARHGTYHLHASWAADALLVLLDAVDRAGTVDRATIRTRIESTRIDGLTGQIRFTSQQHSGLGPASLVTLIATGDRWQ